MIDDIIAVPRPLVSVNDLTGGSMRTVHGVWDSGANIIHWVVELEGGVTRRGRRCVGVVFAFSVSVCVKISFEIILTLSQLLFVILFLAFSYCY